MYKFKSLISLLLILCLLNASVYATPTETSVEAKNLKVEEIAEMRVSVVLINALNSKKEVISTGSGFIVSSNGKIVTNYHVIKGAEFVEVVMADGNKYSVIGVVNFSIERDIAIIKINATDLPVLTLGDSDRVSVGENVVAIGSPLGLQNTVSTGIVSSIRENLYRKKDDLKDIQISAPISPGSSGGALLNMKGEVIGITYAGIKNEQNLNFAIPINDIKIFIEPRSYLTLGHIIKLDGEPIYDKLFAELGLFYEYDHLKSLGYELVKLHDSMSWAAFDVIFYNDTKKLYEVPPKGLNSCIDRYNQSMKNIDNMKKSLGISNYHLNKQLDILKLYSDSIDCLKYAYASLKNLYIYQNAKYKNEYKSNMDECFNSLLDGLVESETNFEKYYMAYKNLLIGRIIDGIIE